MAAHKTQPYLDIQQQSTGTVKINQNWLRFLIKQSLLPDTLIPLLLWQTKTNFCSRELREYLFNSMLQFYSISFCIFLSHLNYRNVTSHL